MADLTDSIRDLLSLLDQALEMGRGVVEQRMVPSSTSPGCVVITNPADLEPDPIHRLLSCVHQARGAARELFERICARPTGLHVRGFLVSREEFYLLASQGLVSVETAWGDPYDVFQMFHYEDSERRGYINPNEGPRVPGTFRLRAGIPPEEIAWGRLRPEQREFFEQNLPEVADRFRREV